MSRTRDECLIAVLGLLLPNGETVSNALARLGAEKKRLAKSRTEGGAGKKTYARSAAAALAEAESRGAKDQVDVATAAESMDVDGVTDPVSARLDKGKAPVKRSKDEDPIDRQIAQLTDLASTLTGMHGEPDAYDYTHGTIVGMLKSEGAVRRDWVPPSAQPLTSQHPAAGQPSPSTGAKKPLISRPMATSAQGPRFQYRFKPSSTVTAAQADQVYGPFGKSEMEGWAGGGYFGPQRDSIVVRKEGDDRWTSFAEAMT